MNEGRQQKIPRISFLELKKKKSCPPKQLLKASFYLFTFLFVNMLSKRSLQKPYSIFQSTFLSPYPLSYNLLNTIRSKEILSLRKFSVAGGSGDNFSNKRKYKKKKKKNLLVN